MKRISFLAFFTLLFMAVEMVTAFIDMWGHTNPRTLVEKRTELIQEQVETRKSDWDKVCAGTEYNAG
ncbi:hypothetical protein NXV73_11830 [Bacteroides salyersiae]|nr:hypothetical protein [Bacteroides salyersiae]